MPGGAGIPREVCKMGDAPARGAGRTRFAGSCMGCTCFPRKVPRPGDGWFHPSAKRVARLGGAAEGCAPSAALRAARGRGTNDFRFFFIGRTRSARLPELSVTRLARGSFSKFRRTNTARHACGNFRFPIRAGTILRFSLRIPVCRAQSFFRLPPCARFPGEPRSPAPASDGTKNPRETPHALPP